MQWRYVVWGMQECGEGECWPDSRCICMCCVLQEFITYVVMATLFLIAGIVAAAQAPHSSGAVGATAVSNTNHAPLTLASFSFYFTQSPFRSYFSDVHYYGRPLWNRAGHYIFALWFPSSFFLLLFSSCILSCRGLDVYHTSTHYVALV